MFNKITSFVLDKDSVEILDNEFVKTASEMILPEGHSYDPDFTYMKVRAVSAGEYWGNNKNADFFPEAELIKNYKTFFDAHVFKNHENKEIEKAIGDVLDATWNDEMKYVELLIRVDKRIAPTIARGFEKGFMTDVSMGCKIDHSICSICGNVAKTQSQYCDHIKYEKHKVYDDGRKVFEININPRFHDISAVLNGADRTAKMTGLYISGNKVAYFEEESLEKTASFEEELCKEAEFREQCKDKAKTKAKKKHPLGEYLKGGDNAEDLSKKKKEKDDLAYYMAGHAGAGVKRTKTASFESAFSSEIDDIPLFEKVASTKVSPKEQEMMKIAEIKKRIKGKVLGVAQNRLQQEQREGFMEGMAQYEQNFMAPFSDGLIDRVAEKISYLSDRENMPVEAVIHQLLKVLIMAGIRLAPGEFSRLMRKSLAMEGVGRQCDFSMPPRTVVRIRRRTMDDAMDARRVEGVNLPTIIRIVKQTSALPSMGEVISNSVGSGVSGKTIVMKLASEGKYHMGEPGEAFSNIFNSDLVKIATELMDERSLHTHCILKRAEELENSGESIEKVAGCGDYMSQYDHFRGENATLAEEVEKIAYTAYIDMARNYVKSPELESDLYKNAEELGLVNNGLEKIAKWKPIKTLPVGMGVYLASKYQGVKAREGRPQNTLERTMAENPQASALGAYLAANAGIHHAGKVKAVAQKGAKAVKEGIDNAKLRASLAKKASENVDGYLNLRFEDELFDNIHDEIEDVDIFKDPVIDEKLSSLYDDDQLGMIKMATVMYANERQDVTDTLLAKAGLTYEDMGIFLEACEETVYEELEKKAGLVSTGLKMVQGVGKALSPVASKIGTGVSSALNEAKPVVNQMKGKLQPTVDTFKEKATPILQKPMVKAGLKAGGAGVATGVGAGIVNKVMSNNNNNNQNGNQ